MKKLTIDDVSHPPTNSPAAVVRPLSDPLDTSDIAINYFELDSGDSFGFDYHRHLDQEEVFYVMAGTVTFRTEMGEVAVAGGECIRFAPGEFQLGRNAGPERVRALAMGAPRGSTEIEYWRGCPECGEETIQQPEIDRAAGVFEIWCSACGSLVEAIEPE